MLKYQTKIYIRDSVTVEQCEELFAKWIRGSKNYQCGDLRIPEDSVHNFSYSNRDGSVTFEIKEHTEPGFQITACMFSNLDENGKWLVHVLFYKNTAEPNYIIVQQEFQPKTDLNTFPQIHRPYIVKLIADNGWIDANHYLSFNGIPYCCTDNHYFTADDSDVPLISELINGENANPLPLVYISHPLRQKGELLPDKFIEKLAIDLIGTAYVVKEPKNESLADKISLKTRTRKVFRGFIGVYFQGEDKHLVFNVKKRLGYTRNYSRLKDAVCQTIWKNAPTSLNPQDISWKLLVDVCAGEELLKEERARLAVLQTEKAQKENNLNFYQSLPDKGGFIRFPKNAEKAAEKASIRNIVLEALELGASRKYLADSVGAEIASAVLDANPRTEFSEVPLPAGTPDIVLRLDTANSNYEIEAEKISRDIESVKKDLYSLEARLCYYEDNPEPVCSNILSIPRVPEDYPEEFNDTVLTCLKKVADEELLEQEKLTVIRKVLGCNHISAGGQARMKKIDETISKSGRSLDSRAVDILEELGFKFPPGQGHQKAYYRDEKYTVTFAGSASDHRTAENCAADILKQISVY